MTLSYPNPSLSNMADESASGPVAPNANGALPKKGSPLRRGLLTAMYGPVPWCVGKV